MPRGARRHLGRATNNVAEYQRCSRRSRLAEASGAQAVEIFADSELIVRQIEGRYRVKHPDLKPLYGEAMRLIRGFGSFRIEHVRRERNKQADRLVNMALDQEESDSGRIDGNGLRLHEFFDPPWTPD